MSKSRIFSKFTKACIVSTMVLGGFVSELSVPIYAAENINSSDYDSFASDISSNVSSWKATAIVKGKSGLDLSSSGASKIISGPDGYYFLIFDSESGIDEKMTSLSSTSGVEYASKNYNVVNKVMVKSGKSLKNILKKSVASISEALQEADAEAKEAEDTKKKQEESSGLDVEYKDFQQFYDETNGKSFLGGQCAAGAQYYMKWLGYPTIICCSACDSGAKCFWVHRQTSGILENFSEVNKGEELQDGDILVFGPSSYNSPYGHVGIYYQGKCYGQNQGTKNFSCVSLNTTPNYLGALRPKVYGTPKSNVSVNLAKDE